MADKDRLQAHASSHELRTPLSQNVSSPSGPGRARIQDNPLSRSFRSENQEVNPFGDADGYHRRASNASDRASDRSVSPIPLQSLPSTTVHLGSKEQGRNHPRRPSEERLGEYAHTRSKQRSQRDRLSRLRRVVNYPWLLEVLSSLVAALALLAIIITLAVHQGRPLPEWPHPISINALIAIFTTIFKASLLMPVAEDICISQQKWRWFRQPRPLVDLDRFDSASRGSWGSVLLVLHRVKQFLVLLGAMITIVSIAIDPFSQQVIKYYECEQRLLSNNVASIPRTNHYIVNGTRPSTLDEPFLDNDMVVAVYLGLLKPPANSSTSVSGSCSTGHCAFPADEGASYQSLAMCYSCSDINATVKAGSQSGEAYLPSDIPPDAAIDDDLTMAIRPTAGAPRDSNQISTFESLMRLDNGKPWAFRCSLNACVKTYGANISGSTLEEHVLETQPVLYDQRTDGYILATNRTLRNGVWNDCKSTNQRTDTNTIAYPFHTDPSPSYGSTFSGQENPNYNNGSFQFYPPDCLWSYGYNAAYAIEAALRRQFFNTRNLTTVHDDFYAPQTIDPAWLVKLYNSGAANIDTVNSYTAGLAEAITANMREKGEPLPSGDAEGTTYGSQTCIGVQWAWLSLPAAMLVLAVIFLTATMLQTRTPVAWKSSTTALLFHGFEDATGKAQAGVGDVYGVKSVATHVKARVENFGGDGWRFVKVD